jgi:hypothetical protein
MITNENYAGRFMFRLTECRNTLTNSIAALKSEAEAKKQREQKRQKDSELLLFLSSLLFLLSLIPHLELLFCLAFSEIRDHS